MADPEVSNWESDEDGDSLARLEAEQAEYAAQLHRLHKAERAAGAAARPSTAGSSAAADLAAENARLKEQLAAMASASACKSTTKHEDEDMQALLEKYAAENAKLTDALRTGASLSKMTALRPSATSVIEASRARLDSMVGSFEACTPLTGTIQRCDSSQPVDYTAHMHQAMRARPVVHATTCSICCRAEAFPRPPWSPAKCVIKDLHTRKKGVDIVILMDGTGSMVCAMVTNFLIIDENQRLYLLYTQKL